MLTSSWRPWCWPSHPLVAAISVHRLLKTYVPFCPLWSANQCFLEIPPPYWNVSYVVMSCLLLGVALRSYAWCSLVSPLILALMLITPSCLLSVPTLILSLPVMIPLVPVIFPTWFIWVGIKPLLFLPSSLLPCSSSCPHDMSVSLMMDESRTKFSHQTFSAPTLAPKSTPWQNIFVVCYLAHLYIAPM